MFYNCSSVSTHRWPAIHLDHYDTVRWTTPIMLHHISTLSQVRSGDKIFFKNHKEIFFSEPHIIQVSHSGHMSSLAIYEDLELDLRPTTDSIVNLWQLNIFFVISIFSTFCGKLIASLCRKIWKVNLILNLSWGESLLLLVIGCCEVTRNNYWGFL